MEDLKKLKALVENPYFGAFKWNSSIEQLESITNLFTKINKRFAGIYNFNKTYNIGEYVFIGNDLYELSKNSNYHFNTLTEAKEKEKNIKIINVINKKLTRLNGSKLKTTYDFDFCRTNHLINETVCIKDNNPYIYNSFKDLIIPLNVSINENIKTACLDEVSIYLGLDRKIIEKSKTLDNINHDEIFSTTLLIKDISCNEEFIFALLSDNRVAKISRKDKTFSYLETNKFFNNNAKITIVGNNNLFIIDNSVLYCYDISNNITLKSEIEHNITNNILQLEKNGNELFILDDSNKTTYCKNTLFPLIKCEIRNLLDNNKFILENINCYINPEENLIDNELFYLKNKEILVVKKNKGIEINKNKLVYKIENNFLNKTIYIKSEGINESYTFNTNNKTFTLEVQENGKKDIFIDLYDSFAEARIIINNTESIKKIFLLPSLSEREVELKSKSTDLFLLKKIVIFDEILDKSRKDRILDNLLYLPKIENKTKNLPYSIVTNDINGSPILKLSNNSLVINEKGLKVNSSEDLLMPININDDEKLLSIKGAKLLLTNFTSIVTNFNNDKANKIHRHNFSDLDNVPYANSDNQGLVILSNDINENASNKAATPFFVNSINRKINTRINEIENISIKNNTDKIGNIINIIIPKINENIQKVNENLIKSVRELNNTISAPTSYLDKRVGGVVNADVTIRNINFGNNIMRFNKDSNSHTFMFFNRGFINHGPGGQGIETFKFAPSTYSNQTTGGIEIGYANGTNFNRTSYISSSGYAVFTGANITGDMIVGRNITLYGDLVVTSDRRLKSDIKKVENGIDKIKKLSGYTFKKIDTGLYSAGVIAQEVQKVMPELIIEEDNKLKVNYNGIHSLEIEAIKELSKQIEELKEEINSLKRR